MDLQGPVQNGADEKNVKKLFFMWPLDLKMMKDDSNLRWQSEPALMKRSLPMAIERDTLRRGSGDR
jgi:hypothetical protein